MDDGNSCHASLYKLFKYVCDGHLQHWQQSLHNRYIVSWQGASGEMFDKVINKVINKMINKVINKVINTVINKALG